MRVWKTEGNRCHKGTGTRWSVSCDHKVIIFMVMHIGAVSLPVSFFMVSLFVLKQWWFPCHLCHLYFSPSSPNIPPMSLSFKGEWGIFQSYQTVGIVSHGPWNLSYSFNFCKLPMSLGLITITLQYDATKKNVGDHLLFYFLVNEKNLNAICQSHPKSSLKFLWYEAEMRFDKIIIFITSCWVPVLGASVSPLSKLNKKH